MAVRSTTSATDHALKYIGAQPDPEIPLADAALWLARWMDPDVKIAPYRRHLEQLVRDVRHYIANDTDDIKLVLEAVRQILARRYGYQGDDAADERHFAASMSRTIDRRRGSATTLSILYAHVLAKLAWRVELLDFAPRTLVGITSQGGRTIIDPFDTGRTLSARDLRTLLQAQEGIKQELRPDTLKGLSKRDALLILQHDVKIHHLRHAAPEAALHAIEGALFVAPQAATLWRELGLLHARLDHLIDAADALERFLQLPGAEAHRYTASQMLQQLRQRIARERT